MQITNTSTHYPIDNIQINSNQPNKNKATTTSKYNFDKLDKGLVNYFELSEDISAYQVSDSKKNQARQAGLDVIAEMENTLNKLGTENKIREGYEIFYDPEIDRQFRESVGDIEEVRKELKRQEEAYGISGYDEKTRTFFTIKEGNARLRLEREQERRERAKKFQDEEPKSFKEYQDRTNIDYRDSFQDRYHLTDEFRKTDKFEELYNEYIDKKKARDRKIASEVSQYSIEYQIQHIHNKLTDKAVSLDSFITHSKSKKDWIEDLNSTKAWYETMLSEAKAVQRGDLIREDGTQRGDTRGGYINPEKVIPDMKINIKFLDTLMNTLKDKWKYGSFDVAS